MQRVTTEEEIRGIATLESSDRRRAKLKWIDLVLCLVLLVGLAVWSVLDVMPRSRIEAGRPEAHKTDLTVYTGAGAAFFDGREPYRVTNPRGWSYLYPPLFALMMAPLSLFDTRAQALIWCWINVALAAGCVIELRRLYRWYMRGKQVNRETNQEHPPTDAKAEGRGGQAMPLFLAWCTLLAVVMPAFDCLQR